MQNNGVLFVEFDNEEILVIEIEDPKLIQTNYFGHLRKFNETHSFNCGIQSVEIVRFD